MILLCRLRERFGEISIHARNWYFFEWCVDVVLLCQLKPKIFSLCVVLTYDRIIELRFSPRVKCVFAHVAKAHAKKIKTCVNI